MSPRKFIGKTSREVLQKVKQALGPDAIIVSNRPIEGGIEVTAISSMAMERVSPDPVIKAAPETISDGIVQNLMREVAGMKSMLQREMSGMAWTGLKQRAPVHAAMLQVLLNAGFSPLLARQLISVLSDDVTMPAAHKAVGAEIKSLLRVMTHESLVMDGGVYALVGPTGVGKTTTIADSSSLVMMQPCNPPFA